MVRFYKLRFYDKWLQLPKPLSCLHRSFVYLHALQTIHPTFTTIILLCTNGHSAHPERAVERGAAAKMWCGQNFCVKSRFSESVKDLARIGKRTEAERDNLFLYFGNDPLCHEI